MVGETWLSVVGWEGDYEVSDRGRVRSLDRIVIRVSCSGNQISQRHYGRVLRLLMKACGHVFVQLGRGNNCMVHKLVLEAFRGPAPTGMVCRHLDGNPLNNNLVNLVWGTYGDNARDKKHHKLPRNYRLTPEKIVEIRHLFKRGLSSSFVAGVVGVSRSTISDIRYGRTHIDVP